MENQNRLKTLLKRTKTNPLNGCVEWFGAMNNSGYGRIKYKGKATSAHRVIWQLMLGDVSPQLYVCHTCDNRKCVNISHLFLGTPLENALDMINKGRKHKPVSNWKHGGLYGYDTKKCRCVSCCGYKKEHNRKYGKQLSTV